MKPCLSVLAAALLAATPSLADMIAASPGVTLTEAAQAKFNRESPTGDQHITPVPGNSGIPAPLYASAGLSADDGWTLEQVAAAKFDHDGQSQGALVDRRIESTVGLAYGMDRDYSQLAAAAGLSPEEAAGMSFDEIARIYLDSEH